MYFQPNNRDSILKATQAHGPSPGAKKMLQWEFEHAREADQTGIYVTWSSEAATDDCFRVGSNSRCFCGHLFSGHSAGKKCADCDCKKFAFIPRRPEEIGEYWLVKRKGFNVNAWRPSCKCNHLHTDHKPNRPHLCKKCGCSGFVGNFACISCDQKYEDHFTSFETEEERKAAGKTIG